jgi:protocatechuate 3,4-dioxygenase beta subunit
MKCHLYNSLAVLVLLIGLSGVVAAQSQPDESGQNIARTGTISGQVVTDSGQPLANVVVGIYTYGGGGPGRTTTTDNEGRFQVSGLEPVAYLVSASFPAYVTAPRDPDINPIGYYRVGDSIRLEVIKGGVITGTVTRSAGEPVVVVPVRAYMVRDSKGLPARYGAPFREQTTDDRGVYRIYGLPPGTYVVSAGGGNPSGFNVSAYSTDEPTYAPSSTRNSATEIYVHSGEETANVDIRYRGEPGQAVSGSASSTIVADQPTGFSITLSSIFNGASQSSYSTFQPASGRGFSFYGVADGDYDLIAQSYFPGGEWVISEPRRIRVKGADITGIELTAAPLSSISGRVVLEESQAPECKDKRRPLFGETLVTPWHNEKNAPKDRPQFVWGLGGPTLPNKQGDFTLRNLAPGQYRFNARPMAKYWYLKSISWPLSMTASPKARPSNRPVDAARNWTALKAGDRFSGLTITIAEGAASLRGQIDLAEGQKLPSKLFVYLAPAEHEKADDLLRYFASLVSADGSFALDNLPPGRYRVIAEAASESESNILSKLRLPDETERRAKLLHDAESSKLETEIKPCQNVMDYRLPFTSAAPGQ